MQTPGGGNTDGAMKTLGTTQKENDDKDDDGTGDGNGDDNDYGDDDTCISRRRAMNSSKFVEFSFSLSTLCAALPVSIPSDTKLTAVFVACVAPPRVLV